MPAATGSAAALAAAPSSPVTIAPPSARPKVDLRLIMRLLDAVGGIPLGERLCDRQKPPIGQFGTCSVDGTDGEPHRRQGSLYKWSRTLPNKIRSQMLHNR